VVSGTTIPGEDPRVAEAAAALSEPTAAARADALSALGIGIVVADRTAPGAAPEVAGRALTPSDADLVAVALPGRARQRSIPATWYAVLGAAWAAYVMTGVLLPLAVGLRRRRRRPSSSPAARA
jgi:hypothetical protein